MVFLSAAARPCECTFVDGKAEGMGVYRWTDGVTYVGEFKAGVIEARASSNIPTMKCTKAISKRISPGWGVQMLPDNTRVMGKFREGAFVPPK